MLVERILPQARELLATAEEGTTIRDAAGRMARPHVHLLVVGDRKAAMTGIVTRTDIVAHVSRNLGLDSPVDCVMSRDVAHCRASDQLVDVWHAMKERRLQRFPIINASRAPIGVAYVRDVLQGLLSDAEIEDDFLRDYISGVGYR